MSLTISEQEVVAETVEGDNAVILTNEDLVESVLSTEANDNPTDLGKLTAQDLEDLEKIQAELDSLVHLSNVTEEVTTSEATFFDHASYSDMPEANSTLADTVSLEAEATVNDTGVGESYDIGDTAVGDNVTIVSQDVGDTIMHPDITESPSVEICTNDDEAQMQNVIEEGQYEAIDDQMVTAMSTSSYITTSAGIGMEALTTSIAETLSVTSEIPSRLNSNISGILPIKVSSTVPNVTLKVTNASNVIGTSAKVAKTIPSNLLNIHSSNIGVTQAQGSPLTIINVSNASAVKGGKQMMVIQKPISATTVGTSLLAQGKVLSSGAGPSKSTVTTTIVPDTKFSVAQKKPSPILVPVSVAQNNLTAGSAMTVPVSLANLKGDMPIKFIMAPGNKGAAGSPGSIQLPANALNLLQSLTGGGKNILTSGGQLISGNKTLKIITAPAGTQFSTGGTATAATISGSGTNFITLAPQGSPAKVVQQPQPTILLASPTKAVSSVKGNPQILRAFTGTPGGKQNVVLLSPVKGKPGTFQNITLKSPQKIAPAPGANKVTATGVTVQSATTGSPATSKQGQTPIQKVVLRPIIPQIMKSTTSNIQSTTSITNTTGNIKQVMVPVSRVLSSTGTMQPIQVPGNKFNYVRLVSTPSSTRPANSNAKTATLVPMSSIRGLTTGSQQAIAVPISTANVLTTASGNQVRLALNVARPGSVSALTNSKVSNLQPRLIVPSGGITQKIAAGSFPAGSIIQAGTNSSGQPNFVMVSAQYVNQLQQSNQNSGSAKVLPVIQPAPTVLHTNTKGANAFVPIAAAAPSTTQSFEQSTQNANIIQPQHHPSPSPQIRQMNGRTPPQEVIDNRLRKPCNCTKSQCLKLYCDCFANGEFCHNCNCTNCYNNLEHEEDRQKAIKSCLDRNPMAFHPKIGKTRKGKDGDHERRHTKGCNCKRSGCLKNYCECYEAKILCTNLCRCSGCKNFEDSNERKTLMHLADAAEVRVQQQAAAKDKITSQLLDLPQRAQIISLTGERLPFSFVTQDVTNATCGCMLARAEEGERTDMSIALLEKEILEEFGRCLRQIIECSNKTRSS